MVEFEEILKSILQTALNTPVIDHYPSNDVNIEDQFKVGILNSYLDNLRISNSVDKYLLHLNDRMLHYEIYFNDDSFVEGDINMKELDK